MLVFAQGLSSTTDSSFSDNLIGRFNAMDYAGIYGLSGESLHRMESATDQANFLADLRKQTGLIQGGVLIGHCGTTKMYQWTGEYKNLLVELVFKDGQWVDYFISDVVSQRGVALAVYTDNKARFPLDVAVDGAARAYMSNQNARKLSIGVYKNGVARFYNYTHDSLGALPNSRSIYQLGSIAKTFVATMVAQAVMEEKLNLNEDFRKYLPGEYPNLQFEGKPIRLVSLMNHTSGLPDSWPYPDDFKQMDRAHQVRYFTRYNRDSLFTTLHLVKPVAAEGTRYSYNGNVFHILIAILEDVYQLPYNQLVKKFVETKLDMHDTGNRLTDEQMDRFVKGFNANREPQESFFDMGLRAYRGGPGMNSTAADMLKYVKAQLEEKEPAIKLTHVLTYTKPGEDMGLGLAWRLETTCDGESYIDHSGRAGSGHMAICTIYPKEQMGIVILVNETIGQGRVSALERMVKAAASNW